MKKGDENEIARTRRREESRRGRENVPDRYKGQFPLSLKFQGLLPTSESFPSSCLAPPPSLSFGEDPIPLNNQYTLLMKP
jgi:hypothetical protein